MLDILRVLKGGRSLADSLGTHPDYFSDLYINMVRAGEASGALAVIFERLSEFERSRDDLRNYIISSMIYPALLAGVGLASIVLLLTFVVPRFASIFSDSTMKIPTPTKILLEVSNVVTAWWWVGALAIVITLIAWRVYTRTVAGRLWWDGARLKIPLLGDALLKAETARFARAMGTLVGNSVPLVQSLGIAAATLNNKTISGALAGVAMGVKRGEGIAGPMRKAGSLPAAGRPPADRRRRDRPARPDVRPHGRDLRNRYPRLHPALHLDLRAGGDPGDGRADRRADSEYAARDYEH